MKNFPFFNTLFLLLATLQIDFFCIVQVHTSKEMQNRNTNRERQEIQVHTNTEIEVHTNKEIQMHTNKEIQMQKLFL